ncbi:MAG: TonB-dependent receptor [Nibricoccus sp.]
MHHAIAARTRVSVPFVGTSTQVWKNLLFFCAVCLLVIGSTSPRVSAQTASAEATGTLTGRVLNVINGQYVKNARVTVVGSSLEAVTDEFGEYRIYGVPAGEITVKVIYPGLDTKEEKLVVKAGESIERTIHLSTGGVADSGETLVLDSFVVAGQKDTNARSIATSEQRYASNMKSVVSADEFGDISEGNVGEFLKYLPGIQAEYNATEVRGLSLNGFDSNFVGVAVDGARAASPSSGNANRGFDTRAISLNNIARAEVIKVPLADLPADNIGGSVNLVTKSAFEHSKPQFNYSAYLSLNSENKEFWQRMQGLPSSNRVYPGMPGFTFNYIKPINKKIGITLNGLFTNQLNENHRPVGTWRLTGGSATPSRPYMQSYQIQDGPSDVHRASISGKLDWKLTPNSVLSLSVASNVYDFSFGNRNITYGPGTTETSSITGGRALSFTPDSTVGATGRGDVSLGGSMRTMQGVTNIFVLNYRFNSQFWEVTANASHSNSKSAYRDTRDGYFQDATINMQGIRPIAVALYGTQNSPSAPTVVVTDNSNNVLDFRDLANYRLTQVQSSPVDGEVSIRSANVDVKRAIPIKWMPTTVKTGVAIREELRDNRRYQDRWTYLGPDRVANNADNNLDSTWVDSYRDGAGFNNTVVWPDRRKMYALYLEHPEYFLPLSAANELYRIQNSEVLNETVSAGYIRLDARPMRRLLVIAGVRYEKTADKGEAYLYDPDAPFRDANGKIVVVGGVKVRQPGMPAAGTYAETQLLYKERGNKVSRSYDGFYPSFGATYSILDNLLFRSYYAVTIGRPNISNILPVKTIDENDNGLGGGTITLNNPQLKPWTGRSVDLSLEYYFKKGGIASVRYFTKKLTDFWLNRTDVVNAEAAEEFGLDPAFADGTWIYTARRNGGNAKISGYEVSYSQKLPFLPPRLDGLSFMANMTENHVEGDRAADFTRFISRSGNVGLGWNKYRVRADLKWNYRGQVVSVSNAALNIYNYERPRYSLDFNISYKLSQHLEAYFNVRNLTNRPQVNFTYNDDVPYYARHRQTQEFGIPMYIGLKGSY